MLHRPAQLGQLSRNILLIHVRLLVRRRKQPKIKFKFHYHVRWIKKMHEVMHTDKDKNQYLMNLQCPTGQTTRCIV